MNRYGQDIRSAIENILLPVSVMIVDIQNRHPAVGAQIIRRRRAVVEVTKPAETSPLRVVAGRTNQRVGYAAASDQPPRRCERTIRRPPAAGYARLLIGVKVSIQ